MRSTGIRSSLLRARRFIWSHGQLSIAYEGLIFSGLKDTLRVECALHIMAIGVPRRGGLLHSRLTHPWPP
jgi:hypothetical protein